MLIRALHETGRGEARTREFVEDGSRSAGAATHPGDEDQQLARMRVQVTPAAKRHTPYHVDCTKLQSITIVMLRSIQ